MNTKRPNKITFRLSDEENSDLQAKIKDSGITAQQFFIKIISDKKLLNQETLEDLLIELREANCDLSSIANAYNKKDLLPEKQKVENALKKLDSVWRSLR